MILGWGRSLVLAVRLVVHGVHAVHVEDCDRLGVELGLPEQPSEEVIVAATSSVNVAISTGSIACFWNVRDSIPVLPSPYPVCHSATNAESGPVLDVRPSAVRRVQRITSIEPVTYDCTQYETVFPERGESSALR